MQYLFTILTVLFLFASLALVVIILVQRPQGGGLSAAFGGSGGGGSDTAFGGRTGDALTVTTVTAFVIYLLLAIGLNILDKQVSRPAVAAAPETATTTTAPDGSTTTRIPVTPAPAGTQGAPVTVTGPGGVQLKKLDGPPPGATLPPGVQNTPPATNPPATNPPATNPPATTPPATPPAPGTPPPTTP